MWRCKELTPRPPLLPREGIVGNWFKVVKWSFLTIFITVIPPSVSGQTHFQPVDTTGLPYAIVITGVDVFSENLAIGDEIGVFDGELCVGSGVFDGQYNYQFSAWEKNEEYGLEGFTPGDSMTFRIWTMVSGLWQELECSPEFQVGDGTFGYGAYTAASLTVQALEVDFEGNLQPTQFELDPPFPNPFNTRVTFTYDTGPTEAGTIIVYAVTGEEVYQAAIVGRGKLEWNGTASGGIAVSSGGYVIVLRSRNHLLARLFTFLK